MSVRKPTGAVRWCIENGVRVGDTIEALFESNARHQGGKWTFDEEWAEVRVTGFGESVIVVRRKSCAEFVRDDPKKLRKVRL